MQPQLVRELMSLRGRIPLAHLSDVVIDPPGAGYDLDFDAAASSIEIDFRETAFLGKAIAADVSRFAAAAFTSARNVATALDDANTLSWGLVRLYYGAFYSGHAVLRLLGRSCSFLEAVHVSRIKRLAGALSKPPPFDVTAGLYSCVLNAGQTGLSFTYARGRVGGTHEAFWEIFDAFLSETTEDILVGYLAPGDAAAAFQKMEAYRRILRRGAGASWLSAVRNEIQYKHARGVWAPPTINRTNRGVLARVAGQWERDPMEVDIETAPGAELGSFVAGCAFSISLCRALLERVSQRSSVGPDSFARSSLQLC